MDAGLPGGPANDGETMVGDEERYQQQMLLERGGAAEICWRWAEVGA
jgi:hypothetical protein